MANREISLYLKYPGPPVALQRLQQTFLECVIEYKAATAAELQTIPPSQLRSAYQLKGTATLVDDELVIQFVPKNAGVHSVRIFGDTRELCRPLAFIVNKNSDVESTPYDHPVKSTSTIFKKIPPPMPSPPQEYSPPSVGPSQRESMMSAPCDSNSFWKDFPTDLNPTFEGQTSPQTSPQHNMVRQSYISSTPLTRRPVSMRPTDEASGDLFPSKPEQNTFGTLYAAKKNGQEVYGKRRGLSAVDHSKAMTPDTFRMLEKDANSLIVKSIKQGKQRCFICNNKYKLSKMVELCEEAYCDACFRRQFILRSAIEHFMVPTIEESIVDVPVNKRATKFISTKRTLPNVNLRGLEPNEVKFAMAEFRKFSPDDNGWINKAVLLPLMKACFSYNLSGEEIKSLLTSEAFQSVITSFGLDERDEVHEIEFLALMAFTARERQRLKASSNPRSKFTGADLQMAYAFKNHFGTQRQALPPIRPQGPTSLVPVQARSVYGSPEHESAQFRTSSAPPQQGYVGQVALRNRDSQLQQRQQRESTQESYSQRTSQVPSGIPLFAGPTASAPLSPTNLQPPGFRSNLPSQYDITDLQQPQPRYSGLSLDNSMVFRHQGLAQQVENQELGALAEEDQEIPTLPPSKDPTGQTITQPIVNKKQPNSKQMMEELKLTGGVADAWMLY